MAKTKNRQFSIKTHDPFSVLNYFSGILSLHVASLVQLIMGYRSHQRDNYIPMDPDVEKQFWILLYANIAGIVGIILSFIFKMMMGDSVEK